MTDLNAELNNAMLPHNMFSFNLFGYTVPVSDTVITTWLIMAILIFASLLLTKKMYLVPVGKQNAIESLVGFVNNLAKDAIGHHWKPFAPYIGTVILFLIFANTISCYNNICLF